MTHPVVHLVEHEQRLAGAVGAGDIARELLVRDVGVVLEGAGGLDDENVAALVVTTERGRELGRPHRRLE